MTTLAKLVCILGILAIIPMTLLYAGEVVAPRVGAADSMATVFSLTREGSGQVDRLATAATCSVGKK